jgi:putative spermidine/putrescine transport system ATP-binding protein/mannopine transport system ATP-binding protein
MDEPLAALDKKLREQMQLEVKRLQRQLGITVVFVTHDQTEALTMADRVAVLNAGRLEQVGAPEELYEQPTSRFVADFLGETNFLEGQFAGHSNGLGAIEVAGRTFRGAVVGAIPVNSAPACLAVRPEKIRLLQDTPGHDGVSGRVEDVVYGGATVAYIVSVQPSIKLVTRVPAPGAGGRRLQPGDPVLLDWAAHDVRIYPKSGT